MESVPLYGATHHGTGMSLEAERNDAGHLVIAGQDIGRAPSAIFGRDDYEYRYVLEPDAERALRSNLLDDLGDAVTDDASSEEMLRLAFHSKLLRTPTDLRPYLEDHAIPYSFSSY